jgi:hypothetical protein
VKLSAVAALSLLASCGGTPQQLPVGVWECSGVQRGPGFAVAAMIRNTGNKPISQLMLVSDFYRDYRYRRFTSSAHLTRELDPNAQARVTFSVGNPGMRPPLGRALRCLVTRIGYLDGTFVSVRRSE